MGVPVTRPGRVRSMHSSWLRKKLPVQQRATRGVQAGRRGGLRRRSVRAGSGVAAPVENGAVEEQTVSLPRQQLQDAERFDTRVEFGDECARRREPMAGDPLSRVGSVGGGGRSVHGWCQ